MKVKAGDKVLLKELDEIKQLSDYHGIIYGDLDFDDVIVVEEMYNYFGSKVIVTMVDDSDNTFSNDNWWFQNNFIKEIINE